MKKYILLFAPITVGFSKLHAQALLDPSFQFVDFTGVRSNPLPFTTSVSGVDIRLELLSAPTQSTWGVWGGYPDPHNGPDHWNSPVGDFLMILSSNNSSIQNDSFSVRFTFSQPVNIALSLTETYDPNEVTSFRTDGSPWSTDVFLNPASLIVAGVGSSTVNFAGSSSGIGDWSTKTWDQAFGFASLQSQGVTTFDATYSLFVNGTAGNGFEMAISPVPEPSTYAMFAGIGLIAFAAYRRNRK